MRFMAVCASTAQHSLLYWAWCALFYYERIKLSSCSVAQSVNCSVAWPPEFTLLPIGHRCAVSSCMAPRNLPLATDKTRHAVTLLYSFALQINGGRVGSSPLSCSQCASLSVS